MLKWRLITAGILIPLVLLGLFYLPPAIIKLALGALLAGCAYEYVKLSEFSEKRGWAYLAGLVGTYFLFVFTPLSALSFNVALLGLFFWVWAFCLLFLFTGNILFGWMQPISKMLVGPGWLLPCFISMSFLLLKSPILLLLALSLVWAADSGAYFAGRAWGKRHLAARISPKKTWEGAIGGLLSALIVFVVFYFFSTTIQSFSLLRWLPLVLLVVIFSIVGDLFESMLKRVAGVKDSGTILPGHGGLLDRMDGLMAALPIFLLGTA